MHPLRKLRESGAYHRAVEYDVFGKQLVHLGRASILLGLRHSGGLPVLVHIVSQRAQLLQLRRIKWLLASYAATHIAFPPLRHRVGILFRDFSKLNSPAH
jgi:hypothetical protein